MFYSHEILTSRKYGVATIWLVATLGNRSSLKKVDRKAINGVNVPKACEIIIEPEAPMALRLQSNLLMGVSRVYSQQVTYVLTDTQAMQNHMRTMLRSISTAGNTIDVMAGKTRPEALLLPDDPTYLPDLAMANLALDTNLQGLGLDLDLGMTGTSESDRSRLLSPHESLSSRTSLESLRDPQIRIPTSGSEEGAGGDLGGFDFGGDTSDAGRFSILGSGARGRVGRHEGSDGQLLLPEVDFEFDAEGNLVEKGAGAASGEGAVVGVRSPRTDAGSRGEQARSDASALDRVRREQSEARRLGFERDDQPYEDNFGPYIEEDLPPGEAFSPRLPNQSPSAGVAAAPNAAPHSPTADEAGDEASSEYAVTAAARQRRKRKPAKPLPADKRQEVSNREFRSWGDHYLANMAQATKLRANGKLTTQAKKNADFYLWGSGIGGVGATLGPLGIPSPLDMFHGEKLKNAILGLTPTTPTKRKRADVEAEEGSSEAERRVRPRGSSEDVEHARRHQDEDEDMGPVVDDEEEYERQLEQGRHAPTPLGEDQSSIMPWNLSASQRSSALQLRRQRQTSRQGSVMSGQPGAGVGGAGRRLTSASPLFGRGSLLGRSRQGSLVPGLGATAALGAAAGGPSSTSGLYGGDDLGGVGPEDDGYQLPETQDAEGFEQYGPAANVETQLAATSQWIRQTLDREAENFLEFVENAVVDKRHAWLAENTDVDVEGLGAEELLGNAREMGEVVEFEELLPPKENTNVVAAQGLLHVLTLASKGVLSVEQGEGFGPIELGLVKPSGKGKGRKSVLEEEGEAHEAGRVAADEQGYEDIEDVELGE